MAVSGISVESEVVMSWSSSAAGRQVTVVEREPVRGYVPEWPWRGVAALLRVLPLGVVRRFT